MQPCAYSSIVSGHDKTNPLNSAVWCRLFNLKLYCDGNQGRETDRDGKTGNLLGDNVTPPSLPSSPCSPPVTQQSVCVRESGATRCCCLRGRRHRELPPPLPPPPHGPGGKQSHARSHMRAALESTHTLSLSLSLSLSLDSHFSLLSFRLACNLSSPASLSLYFYLSSPRSHSLSHSITHTHTHLRMCCIAVCSFLWIRLA